MDRADYNVRNHFTWILVKKWYYNSSQLFAVLKLKQREIKNRMMNLKKIKKYVTKEPHFKGINCLEISQDTDGREEKKEEGLKERKLDGPEPQEKVLNNYYKTNCQHNKWSMRSFPRRQVFCDYCDTRVYWFR